MICIIAPRSEQTEPGHIDDWSLGTHEAMKSEDWPEKCVVDVFWNREALVSDEYAVESRRKFRESLKKFTDMNIFREHLIDLFPEVLRRTLTMKRLNSPLMLYGDK